VPRQMQTATIPKHVPALSQFRTSGYQYEIPDDDLHIRPGRIRVRIR
jgi:hypothetical protein